MPISSWCREASGSISRRGGAVYFCSNFVSNNTRSVCRLTSVLSKINQIEVVHMKRPSSRLPDNLAPVAVNLGQADAIIPE
jgi:hypothetical protein